MKKIICTLLALLTLCVSAGAAYIMDGAGILDEYEAQLLEEQAQAVADAHGFGAYVITVEDMAEYGHSDPFEAATALYTELALPKDGALLLLSMAERDYSFIANGDFGNYAFNDAGREALTAFFLEDLAIDSWYVGFSDYLTWCDDYLTMAENGTPYTAEHQPVDIWDVIIERGIYIAVALVASLAIAGIVVLIMSSGMKSVAPAAHAATYTAGNLQLEKSLDTYTHTTTSRVKRTTNTASAGSSAPRTSRSGSFSGTSGKF